VDADWSFGDHKETILEFIEKRGANVLWANTNVHFTRPLLKVAKKHPDISMIGQDLRQVDKYDDKEWASRWLQSLPGLKGSFPPSWIVLRDNPGALDDIPLPLAQQAEVVRAAASDDGATASSSKRSLWPCFRPERTMNRWRRRMGTGHFQSCDAVTTQTASCLMVGASLLLRIRASSRWKRLPPTDPEYEKIQKRCDLAGQALGTLATIRLD